MRLITEMLFNFSSQLTAHCMKTTIITLFYKHCTTSLISIHLDFKKNLISIIVQINLIFKGCMNLLWTFDYKLMLIKLTLIFFII